LFKNNKPALIKKPLIIAFDGNFSGGFQSQKSRLSNRTNKAFAGRFPLFKQ
jgi:hypothetical protein